MKSRLVKEIITSRVRLSMPNTKQVFSGIFWRLLQLANVASFGGSNFQFIQSLKLLMMGPAFSFSARMTFASLLALAIAFQIGMDSPQWAMMTVWIVGLGSRGESLSKAKWRLIGTLIGVMMSVTVISSFQQPGWIIIIMAFWMSLCVWLATFVSNFRAYGIVLSGYTAAIICMDSIADPLHIFDIAVARGTYIFLGIVVEIVVSTALVSDLTSRARNVLYRSLHNAITQTCATIGQLLETGAQEAARNQFSTIVTSINHVEFREIEMHASNHEGDHARAALASMSTLISRGIALAVRIKTLDPDKRLAEFHDICQHVKTILPDLPNKIWENKDVHQVLKIVDDLRQKCHRIIYKEADHPSLTHSIDNIRIKTTDYIDTRVNLRVLLISLDDLLEEVEKTISECHTSFYGQKDGRRFIFSPHSPHSWRDATIDATRIFVAVILAGLLWKQTHWYNGQLFISFLCMTVGRFSIMPTPLKGSLFFLIGMLAAILTAGVLNFAVLPVTNCFFAFTIIVLFLFIGGLVTFDTKTRITGIGFNIFLPLMLNPINQLHLTFFSFILFVVPMAAGIGFGALSFRLFIPPHHEIVKKEVRRAILDDLRQLVVTKTLPIPHLWMAKNVERFVRMTQHIIKHSDKLHDIYTKGALATMTIGLNIIRLRSLLAPNHIPQNCQPHILAVLRRMSHFPIHTGQVSRLVEATIRHLRANEYCVHDSQTRMALTRGISSLIIISHELDANNAFFEEKNRQAR